MQSTFFVQAGNYFLSKTIFGNEPDTFFDWLRYIIFVTATLLQGLENIFLSVCSCFLRQVDNFLCQSVQIFKWVCKFFMSRNAIFWASPVQKLIWRTKRKMSNWENIHMSESCKKNDGLAIIFWLYHKIYVTGDLKGHFFGQNFWHKFCY